MQDPNNPDGEEFFEGEFDEFEHFDDLPEDAASYESPLDVGEDAIPSDDDSFMDAGWDDFDETNAAAAATGRKSRSGGKGLSFNTIVIGLAVVVGLGVLAYQVLTTPAPGSGAARFQSVLDFTGSTDGPVLGQTDQQNQIPSADPMQNADAGFLNNPDMLDGAAPVSPADPALDGGLPMPSPISNDIDDHGMEQEMAAPDVLTPMPDLSFSESEATPVPRGPDTWPAPEESVAESAAPSPAMDIIRRAQTQQQEQSAPPVAEPVVAPPASAPTPAPVVADAGLSQEVLSRLDALADRLSVMEQQVVQLRESGQTDLEGLEKEIASLKSGLNRTAAPAPAAATPAPAPKREAPKAAAPAPKQETRPAPRAPAPAAATSASGAWELRAAQPGRAWVSRPGSREMQSVSVGDTLGGIGQIVRIDYANGRWTVVGTQGQIRQ